MPVRCWRRRRTWSRSPGARAQPLSGPLRLGVIPTIAPFLLPVILPPLRAQYPQLQLYLREDLTERLLERLRAADLDLALIALPYDTGELTVRRLFKDEFWFVARADDPLASAKEVAVRDLRAGHIVLLEEGHCLRDHAIAACGARAANPESMVEATSLHTLLQMVEGGMGATLLPEMTLKAGILNGTESGGAALLHAGAGAHHRPGGAADDRAPPRLRSARRSGHRAVASRHSHRVAPSARSASERPEA